MKMAFLAAAAMAMSVVSAQAATLDFTFSFTNTANGGGTVTGIVRGLTDNTTSAATSVEVLTNSDGFGIGEYVGNPISNLWTLVAGNIFAFSFRSNGAFNTAPNVTDSSLLLNGGGGGIAALAHSPNGATPAFGTGIAFTPVSPAEVPLPAAGILLAGALGGLAAARRRKAA